MIRTSSLALLLLAAAPLALAAGSEHGGAHASSEGWWTLAKHALNLAVLGWVLVRYAGPALRDFLRDRSENLRARITSAERALAAAQQELDQLRGRVARADEEARALLREAELAAEGQWPRRRRR